MKNHYVIAGIVCILILGLEIFGLFSNFVLFGDSLFGIGDFIIIAACLYFIHKSFWKKENYSQGDLVGLGILVIWFSVAFLYGFMIGLSGYI